MRVLIDYSDGRYSTRTVDADETARLEAQGVDVAHVEDDVWAAYREHCLRDGIWQALWRSISNEQYVERRQKELLPLEEADREIARLKEDLARSQRMEKFYAQENHRHRHERHRAQHHEFTCVFPLPGCNVDVLPPKWREDAQDILDGYSTSHAAEGMKIQGCCCGHDHEKLDDATAKQLRNHGFIVEQDAEPKKVSR